MGKRSTEASRLRRKIAEEVLSLMEVGEKRVPTKRLLEILKSVPVSTGMSSKVKALEAKNAELVAQNQELVESHDNVRMQLVTAIKEIERLKATPSPFIANVDKFAAHICSQVYRAGNWLCIAGVSCYQPDHGPLAKDPELLVREQLRKKVFEYFGMKAP